MTGPTEADPRGSRLDGGADGAAIPSWMRPLADRIDGLELPARLRPLAPRTIPTGVRHSAVLILLAEGSRGPDVLLTGRASTLRSHAGQPAFPGGRCDPGETAVQAALREGEEETGLDPASVRPVALLPELFLGPSANLVRPVLGHWHTPGPVSVVDPAETSSVARVPLSELADPANRGRVRFREFASPAFDVADLVVWGFTAGLLDLLLDLGGWARPWDREKYFELPDPAAPAIPTGLQG